MVSVVLVMFFIFVCVASELFAVVVGVSRAGLGWSPGKSTIGVAERPINKFHLYIKNGKNWKPDRIPVTDLEA